MRPGGKGAAKLGRLALGFALIALCFGAGVALQGALHLLVPGNVVGLFLLLGLFAAGIVRVEWVEEASGLLIFLLPLLFVPIYVYAGHDKPLWREWGAVLLATLAAAVVAMWLAVGWVAGRVFRPVPAEK